jgi:N-acetylmuramoyl-L-alanine amidase
MSKLFKIVLDAGHGGKTPVEGSSPNNAVAPNGLLEKDLTLKIAQIVSEKLPKDKFQTFLTRNKDENLSLKQRVGKSREVGADAFVSIHFNGSRKPNFDGTEVFVSESSDDKDYLLANELLKNVANAASTGKRGIREVDFTILKGKYRVRQTAACLIEMAYLTNPQQAKNLSSPKYLDKLAAAVTQAIVNYTKQTSHAQSLADQSQGAARSFGLDNEFDVGDFETLEAHALGENPKFDIKESVGRGGSNKEPDVLAVKKRLIELGFDWITADKSIDVAATKAIQLFQSIIKGSNSIGGDGKIDAGKNTHRWLQAKNAPRWQKMSQGSTAEGFFNYELTDTKDTHDFGTDWLDKTIKKAAAHYRDNYLKNNSGAALLTVNDVSLPHGGNTPDHSGHETGLACDLQLPRTDGKSGYITYQDKLYDQNAARAMLQALRAQSNVSTIYFNDSQLAKEKLCLTEKSWCDKANMYCHDNHIHFEILPPPVGEIETLESKGQSWFAYSADAESVPLPADCKGLTEKKLFLDYTGQKSNGRQIKFGLVWNNQPQEAEAVDVVVHFHGHNISGRITSEDEFYKYLANTSKIENEKTFFKHAAGISGLDPSRRKATTIGIIPFGSGYFSPPDPKIDKKNYSIGYNFGYLTDKAGDLEKLVDFALAQFAKCHSLKRLTQNRLILTAHSGGGKAVSLILPNAGTKVDEVHLFDCVYGKQYEAMGKWAEKKAAAGGGALRAIYKGTRGTEKIAEYWGNIPAALSGFYRIEKTACEHNDIPKKFGALLLEKADAALDVDQCNPKPNPKPTTAKQKSLAFYDENEIDYFATREENFGSL